ncbi:MAG: glycosyltransferase family 4 protein, partial [Deltaproteobacteria bacterium]|nr:glycosyltransferase family 4 protein [Deltaproteobacteria bacterium]
MKICMLVRNNFTHDTRVIKEARSLIAAGHDVEVIASADGGLPDYEVREDKIVVRRVGEMAGPSGSHGWALLRSRSPKLDNLASIFLRVGNWVPPGIGIFLYQTKFLRWLVSIVTLPFALLPVLLNAGFKVVRSFARKMVAWTNKGLLFSHNDDEFVKVGILSGADVFHAHDLNTLFPAAVLAKKTGASLVYDSHELYVHRNSNENQWRRLRWLLIEAQMIRQVDEVITVSESIAEVLVERYKIEKPTLVRNVQEYSQTWRKGALRELPELQHVSPQDRIAIYAGRITAGRGLGIMVEASQYLKGVTIVLLGRENVAYSRKLKAMIRARGVGHKVILVPPVEPDEVCEYISSADVGLMLTENECLSYYYGAGNKLFHYLMAGVPVIVSDQPEKRKIVERYEVGRFCKIDDPRE